MRLSVRRWLPGCVLAVALAGTAPGQTLFPGLTGAALRDSLVAHYKPTVTLSYDDARDTLFAVIENAGDDSLRGVYTGYALYLDPALDPTQAACDGDGDGNPSTCGSSLDINTEHAWPQSYGAGSGQPKQDMHHLFPVRADVNSTRSNHPYAVVDDAVADKWFRGGLTTTTQPADHLGEYAAFDADTDTFEPRDAVKGDVARAMFYFYTMYRAEADAAVANTGLTGGDFFELQKNTLRAWHLADPADAAEQARTQAIAAYEGGKPNPYVLDPTLVDRAFFSAPLPVELTAFEAILDDGRVRLRWTTASETRNAGFEVQHAASGEPWETLAFVEGHGTTAEPRHYALAAPPLPPGPHRFRLRQVDFDGGASFGPEVTARVPVPAVYALDPAYPNPFADATTFTLTVARGQRVRVQVHDVLGRTVATLFEGRLPGGEPHRFRFAPGTLPDGLYLLHAVGETFVATRTVTRLR